MYQPLKPQQRGRLTAPGQLKKQPPMGGLDSTPGMLDPIGGANDWSAGRFQPTPALPGATNISSTAPQFAPFPVPGGGMDGIGYGDKSWQPPTMIAPPTNEVWQPPQPLPNPQPIGGNDFAPFPIPGSGLSGGESAVSIAPSGGYAPFPVPGQNPIGQPVNVGNAFGMTTSGPSQQQQFIASLPPEQQAQVKALMSQGMPFERAYQVTVQGF